MKKVDERQLTNLIKKEVKKLLESRYAQLGGAESQPHLAEMQEMVRKLGTMANDLIDKLGGSKEIQDAQSYIDDAARAISGAMESVRYSLEQQGLSEQISEPDPRVVAMQQCVGLLEELTFDSLESALDNMNTEVIRKLNIMLRELDYKRNQVGNISENERRFNEVFNSEEENLEEFFGFGKKKSKQLVAQVEDNVDRAFQLIDKMSVDGQGLHGIDSDNKVERTLETLHDRLEATPVAAAEIKNTYEQAREKFLDAKAYLNANREEAAKWAENMPAKRREYNLLQSFFRGTQQMGIDKTIRGARK